MMKIVNLEQGSEAWLDWRRTGIGSSDAPSILDISPWKSRKDLWEEKVFDYHKNKKVLSCAQMAKIMQKMKEKESKNESSKNRGKKLEDPCRKEYEEFMGYRVDPVCGTDSELEFLKVSLDGWNEEKGLFVEIKAPNQKSHELAIANMVPDYYVPQLLHQFVITGVKQCHYISYHDKYPPGQRLVIVDVNEKSSSKTLQSDIPLMEQIDIMKKEMIHFWEMVQEVKYY